jgi:DNA gyrase subunit A
MKSAYIDYSMSGNCIKSASDVRDGLKPVHRRVLYGMYDLEYFNKAHKKSARIVWSLGKYHPHGDTSVYDAMRMAQEWYALPLVDGQLWIC